MEDRDAEELIPADVARAIRIANNSAISARFGMQCMSPDTAGFGRHIEACNNARLPGDRLALRLDGTTLGWVDVMLAPGLAAHGLIPGRDGAIDIHDTAILERLAQDFAAEGHFRFRGELFDIMASPGGPSVGRIDRGALPSFGLMAAGVHVNGLVDMPDGPSLWVGRRASNKALDPGKLDHLLAGGISAGHTPEQTLVKEGHEECNLPEALARQAVKVAEITYRMERPEGLRRDLLHCYDLLLPPDWVPVPNDGEVEEFRLLPLGTVFEAVRDSDAFKFNVNLVLIDLFLRRGLLDEKSPEGQRLRAGLDSPI
jgi:8-oxo-dGTP pyrophosphatase MutT (NUDIX family)